MKMTEKWFKIPKKPSDEKIEKCDLVCVFRRVEIA